MSNLAVEELLKTKNRILAERDRMLEKSDKELSDIHYALKMITGKTIAEVETMTTVYDDENPDYIKGSIED